MAVAAAGDGSVFGELKSMSGYSRTLAGGAAADGEEDGVGGAAILEVVAVAAAGGESGAIAGAQRLLAGVGDEDDLAEEHPDELVLFGVPVALARPGAGRQADEVDAELREAGGVAEAVPARAPGRARRRERGSAEPV